MAHTAGDTDLNFRYYLYHFFQRTWSSPSFVLCVCIVADNYNNKYFQDRDRVQCHQNSGKYEAACTSFVSLI
jgi:hypothetical protein